MRAEAALRMAHLQRIEDASREGSWQASLALLERRFPNDFGRRTAIVGASGGPIEIVDRKIEDYPFLSNPIVREAACAFFDALAEHDACEAVEVAKTIAANALDSEQ